MLDMPYFMTDKSWYEFDAKKKRFVLTDKAPQKAEQSIKQFYEELERLNS